MQDSLEIFRLELAAMFVSRDATILNKDLSRIIRTWNSAAKRTFGDSAAEIVGHPIHKTVPDDRRQEVSDVGRHGVE